MGSHPHSIDILDLFEDQKNKQLRTQGKPLVDTIKMMAYRAETAMANSLRETMFHPEVTRSLPHEFYQTEANLLHADINHPVYIPHEYNV